MPPNSTIKCKCCSKTWACNGLKRRHEHRDFEKDPEKSCQHCPKYFRQFRDLIAHQKVHRQSNIFQCEYCMECFPTKNKLFRHQMIDEVINWLPTSIKIKTLPSNSDYMDEEWLEADFMDPDELSEEHVSEDNSNKSNKIKCDCCNLTYACNGLKRQHLHRNYEKDPARKCNQCPRYFREKRDLKSHKKVHRQSRSYRCEYCHGCFASKDRLSKHKSVDEVVNWTPSARGNLRCGIRCTCCNVEYACMGLKKRHMHNDYEQDPKKACDLCPSYFRQYRDLESHKKVHQQVNVFKCKHCSECFGSEGKLEKHQREDFGINWLPSLVKVTAKAKNIRCDCCDQVYECNGLKKRHLHRGFVKDPKKSCGFCPGYFQQILKLETHKRVHMQSKTFACEFCHECFGSKTKLFRHQSEDVPINWVPSSTNVSGIPCLNCAVCSESYACQGLRDEHSRKSHESNGAQDQVICDLCSVAVANPLDLETHKQLHIGDAETFNCIHCGQVFGSSAELNQHAPRLEALISNIQPRIELFKYQPKRKISKRYTCDICGKGFCKLFNIKKHLGLHSQNLINNTFICDYCGHVCKTKAMLERHLHTHTGGNKSFHCPICGKYFAKEYKTTHLAIHNGERKFQCTECGKRFYTSGKLTTHLKSHKPIKNHKCRICDRSYVYPALLEAHIRSKHTGERPFNCTVCARSFAGRRNLYVHKLVHRAKRYQCRHCDRSFVQSSGRRGHEIKVHDAV